jgi:hypothetical protein
MFFSPERLGYYLSLFERPLSDRKYVIGMAFLQAGSPEERKELLKKVVRARQDKTDSRIWYPGDDGCEHFATILAAAPMNTPGEPEVLYKIILRSEPIVIDHLVAG